MRSGDQLLVTAEVTGTIRLTAQHREAPAAPSELYRKADSLRDLARTAAAPPAPAPAPPPVSLPPAPPQTETRPLPPVPAPEPSAASTQPSDVATDTGGEPEPTTRGAATRPVAGPTTAPVAFEAEQIETAQTPENRAAILLSGGVMLFQQKAKGDIIELRAQRGSLHDGSTCEGSLHLCPWASYPGLGRGRVSRRRRSSCLYIARLYQRGTAPHRRSRLL